MLSELAVSDGFTLRGFLAGAAFDFGKYLTHFGGERAGDQHAKKLAISCTSRHRSSSRLTYPFVVERSRYVRIRMGGEDDASDLPFRNVLLTAALAEF